MELSEQDKELLDKEYALARNALKSASTLLKEFEKRRDSYTKQLTDVHEKEDVTGRTPESAKLADEAVKGMLSAAYLINRTIDDIRAQKEEEAKLIKEALDVALEKTYHIIINGVGPDKFLEVVHWHRQNIEKQLAEIDVNSPCLEEKTRPYLQQLSHYTTLEQKFRERAGEHQQMTQLRTAALDSEYKAMLENLGTNGFLPTVKELMEKASFPRTNILEELTQRFLKEHPDYAQTTVA